MTALLLMLLLGHMPTETWLGLEEDNRLATLNIVAKRYFAVNKDCAEAEIVIEIKDDTTYFYGKCKKPFV